MAPPGNDGLSLKTLKIGVRLLLLVQDSMCLLVEIEGLNTDYNHLRNADGIIKANHIQALDNEENASDNKANLPLTADINAFNRMGVATNYDDFALNEIRQAPTSANSQETSPRQPQEKIGRYEKPPSNNLNMNSMNNMNLNNNPVSGSSAEIACHMDIEYKLTKRVLGRCTNLGRSARGCIAGNYLQVYHPACFKEIMS